jgi:hypothetical protein
MCTQRPSFLDINYSRYAKNNPGRNRVMGPDRFFSISTYAIKGDQG